MNNNPFSLRNKLVLVTGASSGIGRQCAISFSQMGAEVVLFGRDAQRLNETLNQMFAKETHLIYSVDLNDYQHVADIIPEIVNTKGKISGLVNCAGISTTLPFNAVTPEKMDLFFKTNVLGALNLTKQVVKVSNFSEKGGSIIFISSVMGVAGENGKSLYSMTKGALISSMKSLSVELARRKIRVNSVSPGVVETPMSKGAIYSRDEESINKIRLLHPLGLGRSDDVANACTYLLSDAARWITGINLIVDGGYLSR